MATEVDYIAQGHHHVSDRHGGSVCASLGPGRQEEEEEEEEVFITKR